VRGECGGAGRRRGARVLAGEEKWGWIRNIPTEIPFKGVAPG
jgi:hypothetical protein